MTERTCACGKPIPDNRPQNLCPSCVTETRDLLDTIPSLVDDLNLTVTRQTATGARNGARSTANDTVAWNERASRVLIDAMTRLLSWTRTIAVPVLERDAANLTAQRSRYLAERLDDAAEDRERSRAAARVLTHRIDQVNGQLRYLTGPSWVIRASHHTLLAILADTAVFAAAITSEHAPAFLADLQRTQREILTATDTPTPRLYLGPCRADPLKTGAKCPEEVYALDHSDQGKDHLCDKCRTIRCHTCGTEHDVAQRRTWLKEAMDDRLATAGDIARGLANTTGVTATKDQINGWVTRGRLVRHGTDAPTGAALYRVGDVIDLATELTSRRAERGA